MNRPIVAFDTETATLRGAPHLLEIGAVRIVDGDVVEHFEALVRPEVPVEAAASAIHGIVDDDVRAAATAGEVVAEFVRFIGDDWLAAHSAAFDANVLGFEAARHGIELPRSPLLDTVKIARRLISEAGDHKLETLTQHLELDVDVHHRALADAVSCWKVLEECVARIRDQVAADRSGRAGRAERPESRERDDGGLWTELLGHSGRCSTLASAGPKPPRLSPRLRALESACRERSRVTLLYDADGGLARLPVAPRLLYAIRAKGYLEAECVRSGTLKTYRLDRVQRVLA